MRAEIYSGREQERANHGPDTEAQDPIPPSHFSACNARPVHTEVPKGGLRRMIRKTLWGVMVILPDWANPNGRGFRKGQGSTLDPDIFSSVFTHARNKARR